MDESSLCLFHSCLRHFRCYVTSGVDVTSGNNFDSEKVHEDEIFGRQNILHIFNIFQCASHARASKNVGGIAKFSNKQFDCRSIDQLHKYHNASYTHINKYVYLENIT